MELDMTSLADFPDVDLPDETILLDVDDLFPLDLASSVDECTVRFDMPTPPPSDACSSVGSPAPILPLLDWQDEVASTPLPDDVNSYMFEQIFFGNGSMSTLELGTPTSTAPSSPRSVTSEKFSLDPLDLLPSTLETPQDSDEEIDVVTVAPADALPLPTKRLFTLADVDYTANVLGPNGLSPLYAQTAPVAKKPRMDFGLGRTSVASTPSPTTSSQSSGSGDEQPVEHEARRSIHNVLERKRRDDLRSSFDGLRTAVPDLRLNDKSPKVLILKGATGHIKQLKMGQAELVARRQQLRDEQARMADRLRRLQTMARSMGITIATLC
eukprot:comp23848_c1_seq1/m.41665 comp23848_c1_seq1/g.41665  ORF comp23848_c1_seq1/g.41665 comp23848_c1_seq1/m.41665 type:complete len:326 (-) comp23848_c1_seq1:262-1239(-)